MVLPSLGERLGQEYENLLQQVEHALQLLSLGLVGALLPQVGLRGHERVVDDEVDVGVVGVEELDDVTHIRIVQEKPQMLKLNYSSFALPDLSV